MIHRYIIPKILLLGVFGSFLVSSTQASLILAQSVRLTQQVSDTFQIAEIQAFELGTGVNVAAASNGGVASASGVAFGTVAADVNDGNTNGSFGGGSVWHSAGGTGSTIGVTFDQVYSLSAVQIFGRTDCCEGRQNDFLLEVFDGPNSTGNLLFSQNVLGLGTSPGAQGIVSVIPEPSTAFGLGVSGAILAFRRRRRRR